MGILPLIILALIQGITEFLPVSSSGHLVLVHAFMDDGLKWHERLVMDVAVHVGTLFAVLVYFRRDVLAMAAGALGWFKGDFKSEGGGLALQVLIASIPVIVAGFILNEFKPSWLDAVVVVGWTTVIFGVVLWWTDQRVEKYSELKEMKMVHALMIGCAQALALIPGTSRSGITMSAARFLGYSRPLSAHFSLLLSIVAIAGAGALAGLELYESGSVQLGWDALVAGALSFVTALAAIALMMKWLETASFTIFAVYRLILGGILLVGVYSGVLAM